MSEFVTVETGADLPAGVGVIRLTRPPMNALSTQVQHELQVAAVEVTENDAIRTVVIYGGEKVFAAGADIKEFTSFDHASMMRDAARMSAGLSALAGVPKPVIAAVTGYALGGGCELALTADFRISADNAKWGLPGGGGTQRLPRLIGAARAKDLIFTGRMVDAEEALSIGLVDAVVPAAEVFSSAVAMAAKLAKGPALALRAAKAAIDGGLDGSLSTGLRLESTVFASLFATEDRAIGVSSFIEKGPGQAVFRGTDAASGP
jgi:enoyl-CoA hydratase/carnithine racemase